MLTSPLLMGVRMVPAGPGAGQVRAAQTSPNLDFSPSRAYRPLNKASVVEGLQRLPGALEGSFTTASDVASKEIRHKTRPTPSPWGKEPTPQGHVLSLLAAHADAGFLLHVVFSTGALALPVGTRLASASTSHMQHLCHPHPCMGEEAEAFPPSSHLFYSLEKMES